MHMIPRGRVQHCWLLVEITPGYALQGAPTSARAIPVAIFSTEPAVARSFLRKWTGELSDCAPPDCPTNYLCLRLDPLLAATT